MRPGVCRHAPPAAGPAPCCYPLKEGSSLQQHHLLHIQHQLDPTQHLQEGQSQQLLPAKYELFHVLRLNLEFYEEKSES